MVAAHKEFIVISNGSKVYVNDHVYVSPPWELRDAIPYSIARIMEFLPPEESDPGVRAESAAPGGARTRAKESLTRVRLAWYYRPSDLSERAVLDSRLLFAAIFSEVQPVSFLRAKCYVKHKDKIPDLAAWKRQPDRFYFTKLFDPYIKKDYEVIRSSDIQNLPAHIKSVLQSRYEFVITEREVVSDLTDTLRECETCTEWCPAPESVQCDLCKQFFHMQCVQPPLAAKPAKGYGWTCAPCTLHHEERLDRKISGVDAPTKLRSGQQPVKTKSRTADGPRNRGGPTDDKYFKMWPYRYFGLYTVAEDTLDPDDMIFPKAATRIGQKFQCTVQSENSTPILGDDQLPVRGAEDTIEVLSNLVDASEAELSEIQACMSRIWMKPDDAFQVDYLEEAIRKFSEARISTTSFDAVKLKSPVRPRKWIRGQHRYIDKDWTAEEVIAFEKGLENYNAELYTIATEISNRTTAEVVRFYGHWKNGKLREENKKFLSSNAAMPTSAPTKFRRTVAVRNGNDADDEGSVVNGQNEMDSASKTAMFCGSCKTKTSTVWWKAPKGLLSSVMCDACGIAWRKYGDIRGPPKAEEPPPKKVTPVAAVAPATNGVEKRIGTPLPAPPPKKPKPMPPPSKYGACACCRKVGLAGTIVKCKSCNLVVHASAYGVSKADAVDEDWVCEVCANAKHQEFALNTGCLLCPRPPFAPAPPPAKGSSGEFLRAWKPTEGRGWVHAICSIFIPEIQYTDATQLRFVEGMSSLPTFRWKDKCTFCKQTGGGAVVKCPDCPIKFHLSCAWRNQLRFGFELETKRDKDAPEEKLVTFRGVAGVLKPYVWCNAHVLEQNRIVWGPCDASEGETALQMYCRNYKQVPLEHSYGLLRRAYRLDQALQLPQAGPLKMAVPDDQCYKCKSEYSPMFWPTDDGALDSRGKPRVLCHRCHLPAVDPPQAQAISREVSMAIASDIDSVD